MVRFVISWGAAGAIETLGMIRAVLIKHLNETPSAWNIVTGGVPDT